MIDVLVIDDHRLFREGLVSLLAREKRIGKIATAGSGEEALAVIEERAYDVALVDVNLPDILGLDLVRKIRRRIPTQRVIILTMHQEPAYVEEALRLNIEGYVIKHAASEDLVHAIIEVANGGTYVSPTVTAPLMRHVIAHDGAPGSLFKTLTPREREVFKHIADGKSIREIAGILAISPKTAENHKRNIMEKIGAKNVVDLVKYGVKSGIVEL